VEGENPPILFIYSIWLIITFFKLFSEKKKYRVLQRKMYGCLSLVEGYSTNEVIETDEKVIDRKAVIESTDRRPGAPSRLVASSEKMDKELGWEAEYSLKVIILSAWKWQGGNGEGNTEPPAE
jgi:UDP-glucose 4-epimerase